MIAIGWLVIQQNAIFPAPTLTYRVTCNTVLENTFLKQCGSGCRQAQQRTQQGQTARETDANEKALES
jgi:hypothetical protein